MRYVIGIDLGTTNTCAAYIDTETSARLTIHQFSIPQLTHPHQVQTKNILPSCLYLAADYEWTANALDLPWDQNREYFVGFFALEHGSKVPTRLIQSAKSWLCHSGANRRDRILPLECADETQRLSPVEASARYLSHIRDAWNYSMAKKNPELAFEEQEIILTVPASFDEISRSLTCEAAQKAGIRHLTLIEEPQAAFYSWISQHKEQFNQFTPGEIILVCDVGGGTTDFSIIKVIEKDGAIGFQRIAVGDHLLLGGDNIDRAIAHHLEKKFSQDLSIEQWLQLLHQSRLLKEKILEDNKEHPAEKIIIQGKGSSFVQGSLILEVNKQEILDLILNGFFGIYPWSEAHQIKMTSGIRTLGLPYEEEPSITKHLAYFLKHHIQDKPHYVLFNGGTMKPALFQTHITESLTSWFSIKPKVLSTVSLDLAVARGAAYYGSVRRGLGVKIAGGSARSYYLQLEMKENSSSITKLLTIIPRGADEGYTYEPEHVFNAISNTPVSFKIYTSHTRIEDKQGTLLDLNEEEFKPLPYIHSMLRYGKGQQEKIQVKLFVRLTPIGTLEVELHSVNTPHKWKLEFQLQSATGQEYTHTTSEERLDDLIDENYLDGAKKILADVFTHRTLQPKETFNKLELALDKPRNDWSPSILRGLWSTIIELAPTRKASLELEARWWNLAGFLLRPGYGYPLDDFRIKDLWKIFLSDTKNKPNDVLIQQWICFRRVASGLNKGQQDQYFQDIFNNIITKKDSVVEFKNKNEIYQYSEQIRVLAAMELIDVATKVKIGNALVSKICAGKGIPQDFWSLARIGARHMIRGSVSNVVNRKIVGGWLETIMKQKVIINNNLALVFSQLARKTNQREINLSKDVLDAVIEYFIGTPFSKEIEEHLTKEMSLTQTEQEHLFGDKLPPGLSLEV
jgi:molecular chaperone DnaK (HSP70)